MNKREPWPFFQLKKQIKSIWDLIHNSIEPMTSKTKLIEEKKKLKEEGKNRGILINGKNTDCWKYSICF